MLFRTQGDTLRRIKSRAIAGVTNPVCLHAPAVGRSCGEVTVRDRGNYSVTSFEGSQLFTNAFKYELILPGVWVCGTPGTGERSTTGASGGAITNPWGGKAYGTHSSCVSAVRDSPLSPVTTVELSAAHIHEALPDFNATLVTSPP